MYKQAEKDDVRVRVFCETGTIMIPATGLIMGIKNNTTRVCIVLHTVENIESFVMIYKFKGMNGNVGVTLIQSCVNLDNHQVLFHNNYNDAEKHFIKLMQTASKTTDRNIIYYGARNEG